MTKPNKKDTLTFDNNNFDDGDNGDDYDDGKKRNKNAAATGY